MDHHEEAAIPISGGVSRIYRICETSEFQEAMIDEQGTLSLPARSVRKCCSRNVDPSERFESPFPTHYLFVLPCVSYGSVCASELLCGR